MPGPRTVPSPDDVLAHPLRVAAARRLLSEVPGPAAYDRLSGLAARLVGAGHAKVTLFTDQDTVVGGHGLPPGVVGGPALLTGALSAIVVATGVPLAVPDAPADARVAHLPAVTSGQVGAYLGSPLLSASGHVVGVLALYDAEPRAWSDDEAQLLRQLAASVVAELELAAAKADVTVSTRRLGIALEASSVGIWEVDLRRGLMDWDERSGVIFGHEGAVRLPLDELMAGYVHPEDREPSEQVMQEAIEARAQYTVELRIRRLDGAVRWIVCRGRVLSGSDGEPERILGTVLDVTEARAQAEARLIAVQRSAAVTAVAAEVANATGIGELAEITLRGAEVLGAVSGGIAVLARDGVTAGVYLGRQVADAVRAQTAAEVTADGMLVLQLDDALPVQYTARTGERVLFPSAEEAVERFPAMARISEVLGARALATLPLLVEGRLLGSFVVYWTTEHTFDDEELRLLEGLAAQMALSISRLQADADRAAAVAAMTDANQRLELLAEVGRVLASTLDIGEQLQRLSSLVVPRLGDWCWLVTTDEHGRLHESASAHRDRSRAGAVADYVRQMVQTVGAEGAPRLVFRTGQPLVLTELTPERIALSLPDTEARAALMALDPRSAVAVPLTSRGQTVGVLCLLNGAERGAHSPADVETAVEIGRRAGMALHHARLFGQQRDLADALQRSMLTEPPRLEDCEIVVRYVPAAEGAEIGGDWYDAFQQSTGTTVLAIGDVVGHDTRAAAAMGQVRGLLRGISFSSGAGPAEVLGELDRALRGLALHTMATALVAHLEPGPVGGVLLRWASAGHPPPVVVDAGGEVRLLEGSSTDLLLGVDPGAVRADRTEPLRPGATVLLYTDGLVERRDRDIDAGTAELLAVLRQNAGLPLEELCDRVLGEMFLPDAEDDVAVLAVRLA
ncbi:SpoIIE family protein phosphatase [Blastococcus sp. CCUG 61487]|uniref:SpoIIE family protein phosphatase n=1 Tax=Blastococcus sp. CCUG 61487 TaxID=1840703 RepID=UPI0010C0DC94|nr:SpoIIE family protein phosphatase [Blastococcus sp. CCUG 61487]TKJ23411.1 serine/threonine protein phosphatase [Blastococcus sp. CCUG 61487]